MVEQVLLWACYSTHDRAVFLRGSSGNPSLETLTRQSKFETYASMAAGEAVALPGWRSMAAEGVKPCPGSPDSAEPAVLHSGAKERPEADYAAMIETLGGLNESEEHDRQRDPVAGQR